MSKPGLTTPRDALAPASRAAVASWAIAARPHTLGIAVCPVLVGGALAWSDTGRIDIGVLLLSMLGALLLQTGTNLDNDVSDFERGIDAAGRLGLPRATALGLLTARQVRRASLACFALATVVGLALAWHGGWPILVAGITAALAATGYSGGPRPISYTAGGELVVLVFFGLVAVGGTYYLQTGWISVAVLVAATMVGLPASAILVVNNYRDLEPDRCVGKRTLAVCLGRRFSRWEYAVLMLLPFGLLPWLAQPAHGGVAFAIPLVVLPQALVLVRDFWRQAPGPVFNWLLVRSARLQLLFAASLCLAILLA